MCKGLDELLNESRLEGIGQGITQGITQGINQGINQGITQGKSQGWEEGYETMLSLVMAMLADGKSAEIPRLGEDGVFFKEMLVKYLPCNH